MRECPSHLCSCHSHDPSSVAPVVPKPPPSSCQLKFALTDCQVPTKQYIIGKFERIFVRGSIFKFPKAKASVNPRISFLIFWTESWTNSISKYLEIYYRRRCIYSEQTKSIFRISDYYKLFYPLTFIMSMNSHVPLIIRFSQSCGDYLRSVWWIWRCLILLWNACSFTSW